MMPMAMAADTSMSHDEMMTPMVPMSQADCPDCLHHEQKESPAQQSSSCAGHCLSHANSSNPTNLVVNSSQLAIAMPPSTPIQWNMIENTVQQPSVNSSPPRNITDSVVLRL